MPNYSYKQYRGDGVTRNYTFDFTYLDPAYIKVSVSLADVPFTFLNSSTIQLATAAPLDALVEIRRETPKGNRLVDFNDGSVLTEADLDTSAQQLFDIYQETADVANRASSVAIEVTNRFYGPYAADPVARPDGSAMQIGDEYFNTVIGTSKRYTGSLWKAADLTADTFSKDFGSSLVGHSQGGVGAVYRTSQDKLREVVSVKDFGAKGDGTTDDTVAIQKAVNAGAGGSLYFPPGRYLVSGAMAYAAITLPSMGISIKGAGRFQSVITTPSAVAIFAAADADKIEIEGLGFDGGQSSRLAWQRGLVLRGTRRASLKNCWFYRMGDGAVVFGKQGFGGSDAYGEGTRQSERIEVTDNLIEDCWGTVAILTKFVGTLDTQVTGNTIKNSCTIGVSIESENSSASEWAERVIVSGNIVHNCNYTYASGASNVAWGISVTERARKTLVVGNVVDGVYGNTISAGILVGTSPDQTDVEAFDVSVYGNVITNVTASTGRGHGVLMQAGDSSLSGAVINGNVIRGCEDGISFDLDSATKTTGYVDNITVSGNVISDCTEFGIYTVTLGGSGGLALRRSLVTNNVVVSSVSHGINLKADNCVISVNKIEAGGGHGIFIASGSSKNSVVGNVVSNCASDGIQGNGDRTTYSGNTCLNNGQVSATAYGIIVSTGANVAVNGNRCEDTQGTPTQDWGIRAPSGTTIRNNELVGNSAGTVWGGIASHNTGTYDAGLNRTA